MPTHILLGKLQLRAGRVELALRHFERALVVEPSNAKAREGLQRAQRAGDLTP